MTIERPAGAISNIPNCGVVALAATTGFTIEDITAWFKTEAKKSARWKGRLRWTELSSFVKAKVGARSWVEFKTASGSLKNFVDQHTSTSTQRGYIVRVGNHFVAVINGVVVDQLEAKPFAEHWARNKRVSHAAEIKL